MLTPNNSELAATLRLDADEVESGPAAAALAIARKSHATVTGGGERSHVAAPTVSSGMTRQVAAASSSPARELPAQIPLVLSELET